jgi:hypothetical protein
MSEEIPPLEPRVLEVLREDRPAPSEARVRARARLTTAIAGVAPYHSVNGRGTSGAPHPPSTSGAAPGALLGTKGVAILSFVLGGATGAGLHAALTNPPAPRVEVLPATPAPPLATAPAPASPLPSPPASAIATQPVESLPTAAVPGSAPRPSALSAERSLLDEARALLVQGNASGALERLEASRREFPHATLGEERDALSIEALVGTHRYEEARASADAFRSRYPESLFSRTVEGAIRSIP